jgi:hypothetical protein
MNSNTLNIERSDGKETMGEQVRKVADRLKQETDLQIKATSRILGAAAQIAENHDKLIHEVVDMVEEDLEQYHQLPETITYTVDTLKQKFKTLKEAKTYFGMKANSWDNLNSKINISSGPPSKKTFPANNSGTVITARLDSIENELKIVRTEVSQILSQVSQILFLLQKFPPG